MTERETEPFNPQELVVFTEERTQDIEMQAQALGAFRENNLRLARAVVSGATRAEEARLQETRDVLARQLIQTRKLAR